MKTIGVIGSGTMGNGIAHVASLSGFDVILTDLNKSFLDKGLFNIKKNMQRQVDKEKIAQLDLENSLQRITTSVDMNLLESCDLIIEAATENPEIKKRGTKNKICLSSSYKLTLKNIRTKIIDTSVKKIEPNKNQDRTQPPPLKTLQ